MNSHNTLLKKIILLFVSIFIPLTTISIFAISQSNSKLKNQILTSIDSNNDNYISQLNTALNNIYINGYNLINQSHFRNFSNTYTDFSVYNKRTQVRLIQEQLSGLRIAAPLIESTHVYFFNHAIAFHSHGYKYGSFHNLSEKDLETSPQMTQSKKLDYYRNPISNHLSLDFLIPPEYSLFYRSIPPDSQAFVSVNNSFRRIGEREFLCYN